jgi:hypothetical protein
MKIPSAALIVATTLPFIGYQLTKKESKTDCNLSNIVCGSKPGRAICRDTASACMTEMRQAADSFSRASDAVIKQIEPGLDQQALSLLTRIDFLYQCRANSNELEGRFNDAQSSDDQEIFNNRRKIGSTDSEIGFAHERYLYPLVSNFPSTEREQLGGELVAQSQRVRDSHHVFKAATDCMSK